RQRGEDLDRLAFQLFRRDLHPAAHRQSTPLHIALMLSGDLGVGRVVIDISLIAVGIPHRLTGNGMNQRKTKGCFDLKFEAREFTILHLAILWRKGEGRRPASRRTSIAVTQSPGASQAGLSL